MSRFDDALARMKALIKNPLNLIEGTFTMFNLRAVAQESAVLQNIMAIIESNYALRTATGLYLDAKAEDYGLVRHYARPTWGGVTFYGNDGVVIPSSTVVAAPAYGVRFTVVGQVTIQDGEATASVQCLTEGSAGNVPANTVIQIVNKIPGVTSCTNKEAFTGGTDREEDEDFRERLYFKIRYPATSGNIYHYQQWATEVSGVGAVKVLPLWNGPGTVKVSIIDSEGRAADEDLIAEVQEYIDPEPQRNGGGQAPIGALVTVSTATEKPVNVAATVELGTTGDLGTVKTEFTNSLTEYFAEIAYDNQTDGVSPAIIGYRLLQVPGVVDYTGLTLNGSTDPVTIGEEEILIVGEIDLQLPSGG